MGSSGNDWIDYVLDHGALCRDYQEGGTDVQKEHGRQTLEV